MNGGWSNGTILFPPGGQQLTKKLGEIPTPISSILINSYAGGEEHLLMINLLMVRVGTGEFLII